MITGFNIRDGDLTWWESISKLHHYSWMFKKASCIIHEDCLTCKDGGYSLTFTYA